MLNRRVKKLENKCAKEQIVCIVMPRESKNKVMLKSKANMFK